jgi:hypothetical protein
MSKLSERIVAMNSRATSMLPRHADAMLASVPKLADPELALPTTMNALAHRHCGLFLSSLATILQSTKVGQGSAPDIAYFLILGWVIGEAENLPTDPASLADPANTPKIQGFLQAISQCRDLLEAVSEEMSAESPE